MRILIGIHQFCYFAGDASVDHAYLSGLTPSHTTIAQYFSFSLPFLILYIQYNTWMLLCQPLIFNSVMYMNWVATVGFTKAAVT